MTIERTEIINCRIMGPFSSWPKDPVLLDQEIEGDQIVDCADSTYLIGGQRAGSFVILPREAGQCRAVCRNFGCRNNQWIADKVGFGY